MMPSIPFLKLNNYMLKEQNICVCRQGEQIERQKKEIVRLKRKISEMQAASKPEKTDKVVTDSVYDKLDFIDDDDVENIE